PGPGGRAGPRHGGLVRQPDRCDPGGRAHPVDDPGHVAGQCGAVRRQLGAEHRDVQEKRVLTEGNRRTRREHSMKGLLYNDLCTLTSRYKKTFLVVFVLYIVWAILFDMPF